jgi:hypothetical protein
MFTEPPASPCETYQKSAEAENCSENILEQRVYLSIRQPADFVEKKEFEMGDECSCFLAACPGHLPSLPG